MLVNEILTRQLFLSKIPFKSGDASLSKDLKVKLMSMRIDYNKVRRQFDEDGQEFIKGVTPDNFATLLQKQDKTDEEIKELQSIIDKINSEYNDYIKNKLSENVNVKDVTLTDDEFNEIVVVFNDEETDINGLKIKMSDFLEIVYALFVGDK